MLPEKETNTNIGVGIGIVLQLTGFFLVEATAILGLLLILISIPVFIWGCMNYAEGKGHSKWVGLVGLASWIGLIVLFVLPDEHKQAAARHSAMAAKEKEDRLRKQYPEEKDLRSILLGETNCPQCGATVNTTTRDGLHSPEEEPWLLICDRCQTEIEPPI